MFKKWLSATFYSTLNNNELKYLTFVQWVYGLRHVDGNMLRFDMSCLWCYLRHHLPIKILLHDYIFYWGVTVSYSTTLDEMFDEPFPLRCSSPWDWWASSSARLSCVRVGTSQTRGKRSPWPSRWTDCSSGRHFALTASECPPTRSVNKMVTFYSRFKENLKYEGLV